MKKQLTVILATCSRRKIRDALSEAGVDVASFQVSDPQDNPLVSFCTTIEATGGVQVDRSGFAAPKGDPEWIDLGEAYLAACELLGRRPKTERL